MTTLSTSSCATTVAARTSCRVATGCWACVNASRGLVAHSKPYPVMDSPCTPRFRSMHDVIRVVVADDQALVRGGFRALIDSEPDMQVVGEATRGDEAVRIALDLLPDVVLMDIRMPDLDGLQATQRIVSDPRATSVHVVVVTTFELDEYVTEAIRAGASGFLVKDTEPADLIRAVRVVAGGDALLSPTVTRRLLERVAEATRSVPTHPGLAELTSREREVFIEVACGYSNEEIAGRLFLSESTVKTHVSHVMGKLGARDRAQVVVAAYEAGVIRPGWVEPGPGSLPRT